MALKKGDKLNPNGRPAGSGNKISNDLKQWVKKLLENNQEQFEADLMAIDSDKRLTVLTTLMKYAIPTLSSVSVETQLEIEYKHLEALLHSAPAEAIEKITEKILTLKNQSNDTEN